MAHSFRSVEDLAAGTGFVSALLWLWLVVSVVLMATVAYCIVVLPARVFAWCGQRVRSWEGR